MVISETTRNVNRQPIERVTKVKTVNDNNDNSQGIRIRIEQIRDTFNTMGEVLCC